MSLWAKIKKAAPYLGLTAFAFAFWARFSIVEAVSFRTQSEQESIRSKVEVISASLSNHDLMISANSQAVTDHRDEVSDDLKDIKDGIKDLNHKLDEYIFSSVIQ